MLATLVFLQKSWYSQKLPDPHPGMRAASAFERVASGHRRIHERDGKERVVIHLFRRWKIGASTV